jgi:hypothetical protein
MFPEGENSAGTKSPASPAQRSGAAPGRTRGMSPAGWVAQFADPGRYGGHVHRPGVALPARARGMTRRRGPFPQARFSILRTWRGRRDSLVADLPRNQSALRTG